MKYKLFILIFSCILCGNNSSFGQDSAIFKKNQIGGFFSMNPGWDHTGLKYSIFGNVAQFAYGFSYEKSFSKRISFETGFSHSVFLGLRFDRQRQRELLYHIRIPLIVKYFFFTNDHDNIGIIIGYLPGFLLDKQSRINRDDSAQYNQIYLRYGGFDIITPILGFEHIRNVNENLFLRTQLRGAVQNEVIIAGVLIGLNYYLK